MAGYMEYKDSGIPWLGDIPAHWGIERGKNILTLLDRPVRADDEVITCFRDGEVTLRKNRREEGFTLSLQEVGYQGIEPGDLVVHGMDGFAGSIGVSDSRGKATPVLNVMDSPHNKRYLMYYLRMAAYKDVFLSLSTGIRVRSCDLRWNKLAVFPFVMPERTEQDAIVEYIDRELAKADLIIAEAKASIEEYKAWKASIIYEAVTKGLDPNAEMKESGIDIIGSMPAHWETCRLKYLCDVMTGDQDTQNADENGEYPFYVRSPIIQRANVYTYDGEGILMAGDGAGAGRVFHHAFGKYAIHQRVYCFHNFRNINTEYYLYFISELFKKVMDKGSAQSTVPSVRLPMIQDFVFCIPSEDEQQKIVAYLNEKCSSIDSIVADKEALIADLEAYKKALIFEVVTGKRKVV
jgi:type I restriction enzyme S subunit